MTRSSPWRSTDPRTALFSSSVEKQHAEAGALAPIFLAGLNLVAFRRTHEVVCRMDGLRMVLGDRLDGGLATREPR